ncbi:DnaJ domain-containing protein [Patescibacteria group bacterium]|nr:DnaJ domain-containing protein [Patescibacteria group bacterium]
MNNLYKILGIDKEASPEEVKKAYFVMAKKYHPDSADESEIQKFYEVSEAYQILSDKEERRAYDLTLEGGKIEKILVEEPPSHPTIHKDEESEPGADEVFRKKEAHRFRRKIFLQGVFRVIGFSLLLMGAGYILSFILEGIWYLGLISGFILGFVWSINSNFDVKSFIISPRRLLFFRLIEWILFIAALGYFLFILIFRFI